MATDELSVLREHAERYRGVTLQALEMVPEDKLGWRPGEKLMSFAEQFLHIAQVEEHWVSGLLGGEWSTAMFARPAEPLTRALVKARLEAAQALLLAKLEHVSPAQLDGVVTVPNIPVQWPLRSWLWYVVEHEMHHKAQVALCLRLIGIVPPFFAFVLPAGVRPDVRFMEER